MNQVQLPTHMFADLFVDQDLLLALSNVYAGGQAQPHPVEPEFSAMIEDVLKGLEKVMSDLGDDANRFVERRALDAAARFIRAVRAKNRAIAYCETCGEYTPMMLVVTGESDWIISQEGEMDTGDIHWSMEACCDVCESDVIVPGHIARALERRLSDAFRASLVIDGQEYGGHGG